MQTEKEDAKDPPESVRSIFRLMSEQSCRAEPHPRDSLGMDMVQGRALKVLFKSHMSFPKAQ